MKAIITWTKYACREFLTITSNVCILSSKEEPKLHNLGEKITVKLRNVKRQELTT
jgi:hypothetical protein